jgi:NAD(P)-dependent dehydrogenase (short-subunit alcohol dehydrogenase family)
MTEVEMDLQLSGHVALVTGAASGIGLATAQAFAAERCAVALWDVSPTVAQVADGVARRANVPAIGMAVDVTDFSAVQRALGETISRLGSVDHVVHCAAVGSGKFGFPFTNLVPDDWRRLLDINIMGMVNVAHAAAETMVTAGRGTFVFLASVAGQIGSQTDPPYSASKAANINFAQCMAKDLARHGIRVNTVCPGMVPTQLNRSVWQAWYEQTPPADRLSYKEWTDKKIKAVVPLERWQTAEDIASMIVFLSSDRARQVTGQTINVDGGFVMHW